MNKKRMERLAVLTQTDMPLWEQGIVFAGMDEAGRGPLCGNVVTASAALLLCRNFSTSKYSAPSPISSSGVNAK